MKCMILLSLQPPSQNLQFCAKGQPAPLQPKTSEWTVDNGDFTCFTNNLKVRMSQRIAHLLEAFSIC